MSAVLFQICSVIWWTWLKKQRKGNKTAETTSCFSWKDLQSILLFQRLKIHIFLTFNALMLSAWTHQPHKTCSEMENVVLKTHWQHLSVSLPSSSIHSVCSQNIFCCASWKYICLCLKGRVQHFGKYVYSASLWEWDEWTCLA